MTSRTPDRTTAAQTPRRPQRPVRLTAAGAVLIIVVATFVGGLLDSVFGVGYGFATGACFVVACVGTAVTIRDSDIVTLAVTPPLLFTIGLAAAETVRSWGSGNWLRNEAVALSMGLAGNALWLVAGTLAMALIAFGRYRQRKLRQRKDISP